MHVRIIIFLFWHHIINRHIPYYTSINTIITTQRHTRTHTHTHTNTHTHTTHPFKSQCLTASRCLMIWGRSTRPSLEIHNSPALILPCEFDSLSLIISIFISQLICQPALYARYTVCKRYLSCTLEAHSSPVPPLLCQRFSLSSLPISHFITLVFNPIFQRAATLFVLLTCF